MSSAGILPPSEAPPDRVVAPPAGRRDRRGNKWDAALRAQFTEAWSQGVTVKELRRLFGIVNVSARARELGLPPRRKHKRHFKWRDPKIIARVAEAAARGEPTSITARTLGVHPILLGRARKFYGIAAPKRRGAAAVSLVTRALQLLGPLTLERLAREVRLERGRVSDTLALLSKRGAVAINADGVWALAAGAPPPISGGGHHARMWTPERNELFRKIWAEGDAENLCAAERYRRVCDALNVSVVAAQKQRMILELPIALSAQERPSYALATYLKDRPPMTKRDIIAAGHSAKSLHALRKRGWVDCHVDSSSGAGAAYGWSLSAVGRRGLDGNA